MFAVNILHHENTSTWSGVEPATLGAEGQQQTNYATQSARNDMEEHSKKQSYIKITFISSLSRGTLKTGPPHVLFRRVYPERRGTGF
ncbi:hypothetical protein TNCV_3240451 [Trichonephila clavipes]|nr:hypothetical protein TNCV_3240451 [Trichonephila clavipes]